MSRDRYIKRVVDCDASYDEASGSGFIAITGALGPHYRRVECGSSVAAEALGVLFAFELADSFRRAPLLIVRTDCQAIAIGIQPGQRSNRDREFGRLLAEIRRMLVHRLQFEVQHVGRANVGAAHTLARVARRAYMSGEPGTEIETFRVERLATTAAVAVWG